MKVPPELKILIQQARVAKKMSQQDLAKKLNMSVQIIHEYEKGQGPANNSFVAKLEKELQVKLPRFKKVKSDE
jgi:putative transcription factor